MWFSPSRQRTESAVRLLLFYFVTGLLHELAHVAVAAWFGLHHGLIVVAKTEQQDESFLWMAFRIMVERSVHLPMLEQADDTTVGMIRHVGWIFSLFLAWITHRYLKNSFPELQMATRCTALDALLTDLFGLLAGSPHHGGRRATLLCGNLGLIIVNPAWTSDQGETAFQVLKRMVQVSMVRGAQAGGVICWTNNKYSQDEYRGIRSRVVNQKRTDLSIGIEKRIRKDARDPFGKLREGVRGFFGHTRFATSSTATLEGTHPHQWSKPTMWNVYPKSTWNVKSPNPSCINVENFVTHNGDFDFYRMNHKYYDLSMVQTWLEYITGYPMPAAVDSCAIAGCVDVLRTQGSFGLSIRYALFLGCKRSLVLDEMGISHAGYEKLGRFFEGTLQRFCREHSCTISAISRTLELRQRFIGHCHKLVLEDSRSEKSILPLLEGYVSLVDSEAAFFNRPSLFEFVKVTIDAFLDNDLFHAITIFLDNAKGSFGLMVSSSLDANRQIVIAARGQPMSVAVFPRKGLICYASEPAAVNAGLNFEAPGGDRKVLEASHHDSLVDGSPAFRVDLDDLGGEVCLIDWGQPSNADMVSAPHRDLKRHVTMKGNTTLIFYNQNSTIDRPISQKTMMLEDNDAVQPLSEESEDPILTDIQDTPAVCQNIQDTWKSTSLNRLTSCNLNRCIRSRLQARIDGRVSVHAGTVDILLTGCEVSLWVAEQFASDLQKAFPKLFIKAVSSNKLLGVFGQELSVPATGYPMTQQTHDLSNTIIIVVSHSGGNFAPLACSNLLQSRTRNIFVVTKGFDTQISKQLRAMSDSGVMAVINNQIFSTEAGSRPAEPCSLSVAAVHQVLTQIFVDIATMILDNRDFYRVSGAVITEDDIRTLLQCNCQCISALESITGMDRQGKALPAGDRETEKRLRGTGKLWSEHVLEQARALVMTLVYILVTVTTGYPICIGIATLARLDYEGAFYGIRFLDALIYFFLPQINILIIRILQGRNLRHRMVGRTVVIGDIPWVAQAADSFLSKIFACSYSIAGVNVLHGNPADHFVHRHTHRVVRGTLALFGRQDGRLMALTPSEATTCLSVNQASSIQSYGGTCETITIGHNPSALPLAHDNLYLPTCRPEYLCERLLEEETGKSMDELNTSPQTLMGVYMGWKRRLVWAEEQSEGDMSNESQYRSRLEKMVLDRGAGKRRRHNSKDFADLGDDPDLQAFLEAYAESTKSALLQGNEINDVFEKLDRSRHGTIDFDAFVRAVGRKEHEKTRRVQRSKRSLDGLSSSIYVGESNRRIAEDKSAEDGIITGCGGYAVAESQRMNMELYESRCASLQRFVAMCVVFHEMGTRVQSFFPAHSCGYLGYRVDRTHSMLRVATTASPVSGADVRERMERLQSIHVIENAVKVISSAWYRYRRNETKKFFKMKNQRKLISRRSSGTATMDEDGTENSTYSDANENSDGAPPSPIGSPITPPSSSPKYLHYE